MELNMSFVKLLLWYKTSQTSTVKTTGKTQVLLITFDKTIELIEKRGYRMWQELHQLKAWPAAILIHYSVIYSASPRLTWSKTMIKKKCFCLHLLVCIVHLSDLRHVELCNNTRVLNLSYLQSNKQRRRQTGTIWTTRKENHLLTQCAWR